MKTGKAESPSLGKINRSIEKLQHLSPPDKSIRTTRLKHHSRAHSQPFISHAQAGSQLRDPCNKYRELMLSLEEAAAKEVQDIMTDALELSEPFVAYEVARTLPVGDALFVGNSMPIRDMDAFGGAHWTFQETQADNMASIDQGLGAPVAANRGASGIDGVLSTAAGYAFGLRKAVTLLVGDVSFLHDINGLNLLRTGEMRPPVTIVLVNNGGGGIFDFLPIAQDIPPETFSQLWTTPQNVDLAGICRAHGLAHQRVTQPQELSRALSAARGLNKHSIVEVMTSREENVAQHRTIQQAVKEAVIRALDKNAESEAQQKKDRLKVLHSRLHPHDPAQPSQPSAAETEASWSSSQTPPGDSPPQRNPWPAESTLADSTAITELGNGPSGKEQSPDPKDYVIRSATYYSYSLPLKQPLTTAQGAHSREGLILRLSIGRRGEQAPEDGPSFDVCGEVSPLQGLHEESLRDAEHQVAMLCSLLENITIQPSHFTHKCWPVSWLEDNIGLNPKNVFPSVLAGLEAAILSAAAKLCNTDTASLLGWMPSVDETECRVSVNGLLDCPGSPEEAACEALKLVKDRSFQCLKVKVARRSDPREDAEALLAIRAAVGTDILLRADANRRWTVEEALLFSSIACDANLEYIEEPVQTFDNLKAFCKTSSMPVALDETLDEILKQAQSPEEALKTLKEAVVTVYNAAVIVKPSLLPWGPSFAVSISKALSSTSKVVISSAFETDLGLAHNASIAAAIEASLPAEEKGFHGLGTSEWYSQQIYPGAALPTGPTIDGRSISRLQLARAQDICEGLALRSGRPQEDCLEVATGLRTYSFVVRTWLSQSQTGAGGSNLPPIVFLHGFLGSQQDWDPLATAFSLERECYAIGLPPSVHSSEATSLDLAPEGAPFSMSSLAQAAVKVIDKLASGRPIVLVAYSLGARLALHTMTHHSPSISKACLISATAGIEDTKERDARLASDERLSQTLRDHGLENFTKAWYQSDMWKMFTAHPRFGDIVSQRLQRNAGEASNLAALILQASPGIAPSLWGQFKPLTYSICLIAGSEDPKYTELAARLQTQICQQANNGSVKWHTVPKAGHAVHLEKPDRVFRLLDSFLKA